jgi:tetratricopeptide (TPR) repeat protein
LREWLDDPSAREERAAAAMHLRALARVANAQGNLVEAEHCLAESLAIGRETGPPRSIALSLMSLGKIAFSRRDYPRAEALFAEAEAIYRSVGDELRSARALARLARVAEARGNASLALVRFRASLRILGEIGEREGAIDLLDWFARRLVARKQPARATQLLAAAAAIRESLGRRASPMGNETPHPSVQAARDALGDEAFARVWAWGRALTLRGAVALALETKATDRGDPRGQGAAGVGSGTDLVADVSPRKAAGGTLAGMLTSRGASPRAPQGRPAGSGG